MIVIDLCSVEGIIIISMDRKIFNLQIVTVIMQYGIGYHTNPSGIIRIVQDLNPTRIRMVTH